MVPDRLLSIGRFARRCGLSIGALRHYAELGLLVPDRVDPATGYRYYREDQLAAARRIAALRELDVPLRVVTELRDADDTEAATRLAAYRAEIEATIWRLQRRAHRLGHFIDRPTTEREHPMPTPDLTLDPDDERRLAATLFNRVWDLLERADRTPPDDDRMLHAAHASRYHWGVVGEPVTWARGEWQISRVYAVLGRPEPALYHAARCLDLVTAHDLGPFDLGYAHEASARAQALAGRPDQAAHHLGLAKATLDAIADDEERELLAVDLAQIDAG